MSSDGTGRSYQGLISNMNTENQTKRIRLYQQENEVDFNREQPSTSLDLEQVGLAQERQRNSSQSDENEKLRQLPPDDRFRISGIQIGEWQISSNYKCHLNAKIYFEGEQLGWEIFYKRKKLKKRIQFPWSHIYAIRANFDEKKPNLVVLLNQAPSFLRGIDSDRTISQTQWEDTDDFTGRAALTWREHVVEFPKGSLEIYYETLLEKCPRLVKDFPSQYSRYFEQEYCPDLEDEIKKYVYESEVGVESAPYNPSTPMPVSTGSSNVNEQVPFNTGIQLDTTMVNYSQNNPMNYAEQTPMMSDTDTSVLNPQVQSEYSTDIGNILNNIKDSLAEPLKAANLPPDDECKRLESEWRNCL